jgi:molybdenum cofactor cytidylyltransferase
MGRPKMTLPWGSTTVLGHELSLWAELRAAQIGVVVAARSPVSVGSGRLGFPVYNHIINPEPSRGMWSSIQCAADWNGWQPSLTHWVIALGDQPHLLKTTLVSLIAFAAHHSTAICQPSLSGRPRHPIVFPRQSFLELASWSGGTMKGYLASKASAIELVEIDDPGLDLDIDRPEDYEAAKRLWEQSAV